MKKSTIILAAIAICFGITTNIFAQYVTAEFMTYGANGTTLNKVRMDQPGVPYSNGVNGVSAQFFLPAAQQAEIWLSVWTKPVEPRFSILQRFLLTRTLPPGFTVILFSRSNRK